MRPIEAVMPPKVGNMQDVDAGHGAHRFHGEMLVRSRSGRSIGNLAWLRPGEGDELLDRIRRERRMRKQHERPARHVDDRREVVDRVVRQLRIERRRMREACIRPEEQRVTVGRRLRHEVRADGAGSASAVLDEDRLPPQFLQLGGHDAAVDVRRAAGWEGHDHAHRLRWISLSPGEGR
jgi:hypothetical protein